MSKAKIKLLTRKALLTAPKKNYMDKEQLAFFRNMLVELHENTLARIQHVKELMRQPHDCSDDGDLASWQEQANISLLIIAREQKLLPKIKEALERIRTGSYGYCQESGEAIGIPRLLARPTAEYGSDIKGIKEMKEDHFNAS